MAALVAGGVVASRTLSRDLPHEQTFTFRLSETQRNVPFTLHASVTRVGQREPEAGFSITRDGGEPTDPRQTLRLPDGEYIVTADWTSQGARGAAKEDETSRVERVTLTGGEIIVPLAPRVRE